MPALTDSQRQTLLDDLDKGTNFFGALSFQVRSRICAAANHPSQESWDGAYSIIISASPTVTLWQALLEHTDYQVRSRESGGAWPAVPTQEQIIDALHSTLNQEN